MNKPLVSVIIPVYNVSEYLSDCIDSLLAQTLQPIELIFVNDASTDNSFQILKNYKEQYPDKITLINLKTNVCQGGARNRAIAIAQADYIGFADSDDLVAPDMYETLYKNAVEKNVDMACIQGACIPEGISLNHILSKEPLPPPYIIWDPGLIELENTGINDTNRSDFLTYAIGGSFSRLIKKSILTEHNIYYPEHLKYEDNYFDTLLKLYINSICFIPTVKYFYIQHSNSTVNSFNKNYHFDRIKVEKMIQSEVKKRGFLEDNYSAMEYIYITRYAANSIGLFLRKFVPPPFDIIKEIKLDLNKEYPNWKKNLYYKKKSPLTKTILTRLFLSHTYIAYILINLKRKLSNIVRKEK